MRTHPTTGHLALLPGSIEAAFLPKLSLKAFEIIVFAVTLVLTASQARVMGQALTRGCSEVTDVTKNKPKQAGGSTSHRNFLQLVTRVSIQNLSLEVDLC
jgi:hypothetical protein